MDAVVTEKIGPVLTLDLTQPIESTLSKSARRISKLLAAAPVKANSDVQSCLDDFLGAVYALILAKHHKFQNRAGRLSTSNPSRNGQPA